MIKKFSVLCVVLIVSVSSVFPVLASNSGNNYPTSGSDSIMLNDIHDTEYTKYFLFSDSQSNSSGAYPRLVVVSTIGMPFDVYLTAFSGGWYISNANLANMGISQDIEIYIYEVRTGNLAYHSVDTLSQSNNIWIGNFTVAKYYRTFGSPVQALPSDCKLLEYSNDWNVTQYIVNILNTNTGIKNQLSQWAEIVNSTQSSIYWRLNMFYELSVTHYGNVEEWLSRIYEKVEPNSPGEGVTQYRDNSSDKQVLEDETRWKLNTDTFNSIFMFDPSHELGTEGMTFVSAMLGDIFSTKLSIVLVFGLIFGVICLILGRSRR